RTGRQSADDRGSPANEYPALGHPAEGRGGGSRARRAPEPRRGLSALYADRRRVPELADVDRPAWPCRPADDPNPALSPVKRRYFRFFSMASARSGPAPFVLA